MSGKEPTHMTQHVESVHQEVITPLPGERHRNGGNRLQGFRRFATVTSLTGTAMSAAFGLTGCGHTPGQVEAASTDPVEIARPSVTPESREQQIAAIEIKTGMSAQELATTFVDSRLNDWRNNGADEQIAYDRLDANLSWDSYVPKRAAENAELYAGALFIPDYKNNPQLVDAVGRIQLNNENIINGYLGTSGKNNDPSVNLEPLHTDAKASNITEVKNSDGSRTLDFVVTYTNNADKNKFAGRMPTTAQDDFTVTFVGVGGTERVSAISYEHINQ